MLMNVVLAGGLAACYILIVFLQLNPSLPLRPESVAPLALVLWLTYGLHFSVVSYVLVALRQLLAQEALSPGWLSVRLLVWLCVAAAAMGAGAGAGRTPARAVDDVGLARFPHGAGTVSNTARHSSGTIAARRIS